MKKIIIGCFLAGLINGALGQVNVRGYVVFDADKSPVQGVSVNLKGSAISVTTNEKGRFSIPVNGQYILTFRSVDYQPAEVSGNSKTDTVLTVRMKKSDRQLQEVTVSTGYQQLPRERSTGSYDVLDNKLLNQQVSTDIISRLEAVAAGLQVDRSTSTTGQITIRGLSTIRGPRTPLIVVDNFPYSGDITHINPNDVESVTILKDAAATSIWGAQAGNGVIVITTKKGKFNQPLNIDFNANATIGQKPDLFYLKQMSSSDFIDVEEMLYQNGFYASAINSSNHQVLSNVIELLLQKTNGTLAETDANTQINALRQHDVRNDFNQYIYRPSLNQQYALSLNGGSEKMNWMSSVGEDHDLDNLGALSNRLSIRYQQNLKLLPGLDLATGLYYTRTNQDSGKPGYGSTTQNGNAILPYAMLADANGNPLPIVKNNSASYLATAGNGKLLDWKYYPLEDYKHSTANSQVSDLVFNTGLSYQFLKYFSAEAKYQLERQDNNGQNLNDAQSYFARNLVNSFTQISSTGAVTNIIPPGGILDLSQNQLIANNLRLQLNFNKDWGKNEITALAGNEWRLNHMTANSNRYYGYNNDILTFGNVDYRNSYPNFITGSSALIPNNQSIDDQRNNYLSSFANAAYTYDRTYTVSVSGRRDASNLFGLNTNDQWNPFWSAGLAWVLSNAHFFQSALFPYLKLRATYGSAGNIDPSMTAVTTIFYQSTDPYTNTPFSRFSSYYNPDLKWETSHQLNLGLDFRTKNDRLSGSVEYFHKHGTDLFGTAVIDYTTGIGNNIIKNVADMSGNGVDLTLNSRNLTGPFEWLTTLNFSYYKDEVLSYYLVSSQASNFVNAGVPISGVAGKPVYSIFAYRSAGLDPATGDPRGYLNGQISKDYAAITGTGTQVGDLQYFGSAIPTFYGSFNNSFQYKRVSLNISLLYKLGYYFRRTSVNYGDLFNNWNGNADYALRWQKPGDEAKTTVPSLVYPDNSNRDAFYAGSAPLVEKGDNVRIQYINFNYDLKNYIRTAGVFKAIQVYLNINNPGIIWRANKEGIDPDVNNNPYGLPVPVSYSIGLRVKMN